MIIIEMFEGVQNIEKASLICGVTAWTVWFLLLTLTAMRSFMIEFRQNIAAIRRNRFTLAPNRVLR